MTNLSKAFLSAYPVATIRILKIHWAGRWGGILLLESLLGLSILSHLSLICKVSAHYWPSVSLFFLGEGSKFS